MKTLREWAKDDPWKGLCDHLAESPGDLETNRVLREVTAMLESVTSRPSVPDAPSTDLTEAEQEVASEFMSYAREFITSP